MTLKLEPMFKRSITYVKKIDMDLRDEAVSFGKQHEFADMTWYPSQRQVVYRVDDRVPPDVSGEGLYDFTGFRDTLSLVADSIRTTGFGIVMCFSLLLHQLPRFVIIDNNVGLIFRGNPRIQWFG